MDKRVLLIDFDPVAAELTGALLATRGIPFTLVRNHAELDRALAAGPPALVLIDPARPDEAEGMRLCTSVAERFAAGGPVPMILASRSLRGARWKAFARDVGAELFLERPKDDRLLLAAAERALGQAANVSAAHPAEGGAPAAATRTAAPAAITTASAHRAPPPAENELENMVDQMFAQWFAEGDAPAGPVPAPPAPPPARPAAAPSAPAAVRTTGVGAAVLDAPRSAPAETARGAIPASKPTGPAPKAAAAPPIPAPTPPAPAPAPQAPSLVAEPAALRPSGATAPTGPAPAPSRPVPAAPRPPRPAAADSARVAATHPPAPRSAAEPAPPPPPTAPEPIPSPSSSNLRRPLAIAAAVALIAVGAGFVYFQGSRSGDDAVPVVETPAASGPAEPQAEPAPASATDGTEASTAAAKGTAPTKTEPAVPPPAPAKPEPARPAPQSAGAASTERPGAAAPPEATPPRPAPAPPPSAATPAATSAPQAAAAPAAVTTRPEPVPVPEPEAEFIPDVAPDGTIPSVEPVPDAAEARYTGPVLIPSTRVAPAFPTAARQMKMTGQVKLQVKVRADGSVGSVTVLSEPKPAVGFGKAAEAAVRQWRYRPATLGSRAVESEIAVVVHFAGD